MGRTLLAALAWLAGATLASAENVIVGFAGLRGEGYGEMKSSVSRFFGVGSTAGVIDLVDDTSRLDHAALYCMGVYTNQDGQGECVVTLAPDPLNPGAELLSRLITSYRCGPSAPGEAPADMPEAWTCTLTVLEGQGVLAGATGSATALSPRAPVVHPDGSYSDFLLFTSLDITLPQ